MTKQAIIYTRFSPRPNAKECDSCEKQAERCISYCRKQGYSTPLGGLHADRDISGGILNRPGLQAAIESLNQGDVLVVDNSSRLARDMLVNLTIRHQVEQAGATIEFADGSPQAVTPEGKLFQNILAAFAAYERDRIKLNTKRGMARNRAMGKKINGNIPTGMMEDPRNQGMLIKCEDERSAILWACILQGDLTSQKIAEEITRVLGLYRGKPWDPRLIRKLIARHSYWADPVDGKIALEPEFF